MSLKPAPTNIAELSGTTNPKNPLGGSLIRLLKAVPGVIEYELSRSYKPARIAMFLMMILIPTALLISVAYQVPEQLKNDQQTNLVFSMLLYALVPQILTMLAMLVLASPIVHTEIEGQSWIYSLVRYQGRRALLLGRYFVAVLWTSCAGVVVTSICVPFLPLNQPLQTWGTISLLCILASLAYGSLFALIGVLFQKRVMVISFLYALVVEGVLAWLPAVINQLTIAYRLRSILFRWVGLDGDRLFQSNELVQNGMVAADPTGWVQIVWVLAISAGLLAIALWLVETIQYSFQSEL